MDVISKPHPQAQPILFQHRRALLNVFSDVMGINEIDHISIACITPMSEVIFLSHTPSIEYQLMTSNLWHYDLLHESRFYTNIQPKLWADLYHPQKQVELHAIKQAKERFTAGFSIPIQRDGIHLVYSFATKSPTPHPELFFLSKLDEFKNMGHYCFNQLSELVLPHTHERVPVPRHISRRHLTLVINNTIGA